MKIKQIFDARQRTLEALTDEYDSTAEFCRVFKQDESRIRQLLNGQRNFGEKAARQLEEECGLPDFYFDVGASNLMPLIAAFSKLDDPRDQEEIFRHLELLMRDRKKASP